MILSTSKVFLFNEELIEILDDETGSRIKFINLKHPKLGSSAIYTMSEDGKKVYEVIQMNDGFRSWFADEIIIRDGSLYMTSQINPIYLVMPYLTQSNNIFKFMELRDILEDEEFPQLKQLSTCDLIDLNNISDSKIDDEITYYRFNKEKALKWLEKRIHFIIKFLKDNNVMINPPSVADNFITNAPPESPEEHEYLLHSFGMLSEYLDDEMVNNLYEHMKFGEFEEAKDSKNVSPQIKKRKLDTILSHDEIQQKSSIALSKKNGKLTVSQRKLDKVDKQGMKTLSSFFTPTTKK